MYAFQFMLIFIIITSRKQASRQLSPNVIDRSAKMPMMNKGTNRINESHGVFFHSSFKIKLQLGKHSYNHRYFCIIHEIKNIET